MGRARSFLLRRVLAPITAPSQKASFWESQVRAYEKAAVRKPPPRHGVVFVGSSTIRFWRDLEKHMRPLPALNRGFGGAHMQHVHHYLERLVLRHEPRCVVLYAGDNDLGLSTTLGPDDVIDALEHVRDDLFRALPDSHLVLLSIKPSTLRKSRWPDMREVNRRMAEMARADERMEYVDIASPMLGPGGEVRAEYLTWDGLHPSAAGYALFRDLLRPRLMELLS